jgi:hypothetical protein
MAKTERQLSLYQVDGKFLVLDDKYETVGVLSKASQKLVLSDAGQSSNAGRKRAADELESAIAVYMSESKVDRVTALRDVTRKDPSLWQRYRNASEARR